MGIASYIQKKKEIEVAKQSNEIEAAKLKLMQQEQLSGKEKLKFCPHCGKPLP
jgi:hypothetical protein